MSWKTEVSLKNNTADDVLCVIPQGQVFENKKIGTGIQNMAVAREYRLIIPANSRITVEIEVACMNSRLSPPSGAPGNVTIFKIDKTFTDQHALWSMMNRPQP
jgi:hypothetical protein